ncbi:biopolymer transporter ExbD [Candidatus Sumerlaeota bacterium]|nr:biopolymer transporter ExbD [Candidatus Sumerlaeota bacterium]
MDRQKGRRRRRSTLQPIAQINLTSLLDLTFMLLITFIIIAPTLKHGISIDLPEVQATKLDVRQKPLTITIKKLEPEEDMERIYLDGKRIGLDTLGERVAAAYEKNPKISVIIESDRLVRYGTFARVVAVLQKAGVQDIGLVTQPELKKK